MMIETTPSALFRLILQAVFLGLALGVLYSALRFTQILSTGEDAIRNEKIGALKFPLIGTLVKERPERPRKTRKWGLCLLTFFEDIVFCVSVAVGIVLLAFVGNCGQIRWFLPLGVALGFLLFRISVGKYIDRKMALIAALLTLIRRYVGFFLAFPFRIIFRKVKSICRRIVSAYVQRRTKKRELRYAKEERSRLLQLAERGFGCALLQRSDASEK